MQIYAAAIQRHVEVIGTTCMAVLRALQRAGDWQVAEAALLCALPTPPLLTHAAALYRVPDPLAESSTLRLLRALCQRHMDPPVATFSSEGVAVPD